MFKRTISKKVLLLALALALVVGSLTFAMSAKEVSADDGCPPQGVCLNPHYKSF